MIIPTHKDITTTNQNYATSSPIAPRTSTLAQIGHAPQSVPVQAYTYKILRFASNGLLEGHDRNLYANNGGVLPIDGRTSVLETEYAAAYKERRRSLTSVTPVLYLVYSGRPDMPPLKATVIMARGVTRLTRAWQYLTSQC